MKHEDAHMGMERMMKVLLIIFMWFNGGGSHTQQHEIEDMETCLKIIQKSKLIVSNGNESEAMAAMYCAPAPLFKD